MKAAASRMEDQLNDRADNSAWISHEFNNEKNGKNTSNSNSQAFGQILECLAIGDFFDGSPHLAFWDAAKQHKQALLCKIQLSTAFLTKSVREKRTLWVNGYSYGLHAGGAGMAAANHVGYVDLSSTSLETVQWDDNKRDHAQWWQAQKSLVFLTYTIVDKAIPYRRSELRHDKREKDLKSL